MVRWGSRVIDLKPVDEGTYKVSFADGSTVTTDVLIGADGARSKVRPLLSEASPIYAGLSFVEARIQDALTRHPDLAEIVGKGIMFALSDEKGLIAHREPRDELCVYAALKTPADWSSTGELTRDSLLEHFADWNPHLRGLISESSGELIRRPIYALPVGHRWERAPGMTLVGDAAHLMSPFAGEGANLAMQDGAELARAAVEHPNSIEAALTQYEGALFARSEAAAAKSFEGLKTCFHPTAPQCLVDFFKSTLEPEAP
jgi:2-polyprenyl-6-methoxyphenol hydroxylase-like FAD-dependent oxidoreductase